MGWGKMSFRLMELLGEGSQGCVYKALRCDRHSGMQQTVAIKILHSKNAVELWRQEFESLSRIRSPFCVQVLSFERYQRRPALVLEYVEGVSLGRLGQTCLLSVEDVTEVLAQIEHGLKDLHQHGIFHGDLSPQNVLLDVQGRVRLLDFGLANCHPDNIRATTQFTAPERLGGAQVSVATDIYSLGRLEQFLIAGDSNVSSSYLDPEPSRRCFRHLPSHEARQKMLAEKVSRLLSRQKQNCTFTTTPMISPRPVHGPGGGGGRRTILAAALMTGLIASCIPTASQSRHQSPSGGVAVLNVRTRKWHLFRLNGRTIGYSPFSLPIEANQVMKLEWTSALRRGEKDLNLKPGDHLRLEDSDFSH
jgi:serine/threonine protein kinase